MLQLFEKICGFFRHGIGEIGFFSGVLDQIVEFESAVFEEFDQFIISVADGSASGAPAMASLRPGGTLEKSRRRGTVTKPYYRVLSNPRIVGRFQVTKD